MGELLKEYNGSLLINHSVASKIARAKTLNIFRLLDAQRNVRIIRFLYETELIMRTQENRSLDLSTAELNDIDFRDSAINRKYLNFISLS
ncbi:unnamed protein product, partial [Rotaria sp. Silwood1]